jgi:hypothetical protein
MHHIEAVLAFVTAAYSSPSLFAAPTHEGGSAGRYYTGSRTDGLGCDTCHGGADALELELTGLPQGGWAPGETYTIDLAWSPMIDHAGVLLEFSDDAGAAVGQVTLPPEDLLTPPERCTSGLRAARDIEAADARRIIAVGNCGAHRLRVQWRAPDEPLDSVWLHVAGVQGDDSGDATGDGVQLLGHRLDRIDAELSEGCTVASTDPTRPPGRHLLALASISVFVLGLRRRRATLLGLLALLITTSGCARVQPWERGRLAQPDMELEIDPDLLAGPEHAVEYREGSAGALGGGGGGCGCN